MDVVLKCKDCERLTRVSARTADWPPCWFCGSVELRLDGLISLIAPERVVPIGDPDAWRDSYDDWKTGGGNPR